MTDRFCAVVAVRDGHHRDLARDLAHRLGATGGLPVTVFDTADATTTGRDPPAGDSRLGRTRAGRAVVDVAAGITGREGVLAVIDAYGGGPAADVLFDDHAEHVLTHVRQPVVVIGPRASLPTGAWRLLVPVDGSGPSDDLLAVVARWWSSFPTSDVTVVGLGAPDPWPADDSDPTVDPARRAVADLHELGVDATLVRRTGVDPAAVLLDAAADVHDAMLVVAAPRSAGTDAHWFSTLRRLVRHAGCPVLGVPPRR